MSSDSYIYSFLCDAKEFQTRSWGASVKSQQSAPQPICAVCNMGSEDTGGPVFTKPCGGVAQTCATTGLRGTG
jgi:hypothetical protein